METLKPAPAANNASPSTAPIPAGPTGNFTPPAPQPAPAVGNPDAKAQAEAQKRLVEKLHGPQGHVATEAERAHAASTSTLLTTDAHVGKRIGEPHKDAAQEALKVGAQTGTVDATKPVETVEITTGTGPHAAEGKPTDTATLGREGQSLARAGAAPSTHDATAVAAAVAEKTGVDLGADKPPVEGAKPTPAAADPAHAGEHDLESKGKPTDSAKPAGDKPAEQK